jgi:hypothetical protein
MAQPIPINRSSPPDTAVLWDAWQRGAGRPHVPPEQAVVDHQVGVVPTPTRGRSLLAPLGAAIAVAGVLVLLAAVAGRGRTPPNGVIVGSAVNLRSEPNATSDILGELTYGTPVWVDSTRADGWYEVRAPAGHSGFVFGAYVLTDASPYTAGVAIQRGRGLREGQKVLIIGETRTCYRILTPSGRNLLARKARLELLDHSGSHDMAEVQNKTVWPRLVAALER